MDVKIFASGDGSGWGYNIDLVVIFTCRIPVGWFSGPDVRTKSFFSPP